MMKVLIDTNVLISAILSNRGTPYKAFVKAVTYPNHGMICEQNIDEMRRISNKSKCIGDVFITCIDNT